MADASPSLPAQLKRRDRPRLSAYRSNLAFYDGVQWPARRANERRQLTMNYTKPIIHKATSALLRGRTTVVPPTDTSDTALELADTIEVALAQVHEQNALDQLDFDTELDAAVLGDGIYKVWWSANENRVRISAPDPSGVFTWAWPDDPSRLWRVANQYKLDAEDAAATMPLSSAGSGALTTDRANIITEVWTADTFQRWVNDSIDTDEPNPYSLIPFVVFPNIREPKQLWGTSDIIALREPQVELNRALTQLSLIMELSGNPIAILENVSEADDIAVRPGQIWELPEGSRAYLLDLLEHGGAQLHIDYLSSIYRTLYDLGETPQSAFGSVSTNLSGVALELDLDPMVKKIDRKRLLRTETYQARNVIILRMLDLYAGTDFGNHPHTIAWGSILPTDRDRLVSQEVALATAGIHSRATAADELGNIDDPDAEFDRWLKEEAAKAALDNAPTPTT